jgi:hypothetical protein
VTNDRMRLAAWCLLVSVVMAVCLWSLVGSPETRIKSAWRSAVGFAPLGAAPLANP